MITTPQLATARLLLRPWEERDRATFAAMNADPDVMTYFSAPMTTEETNNSIDRYNHQLTRDGFTMFATELTSTGELIGTIGMQTMRDAIPNLPPPAIEIGWRLALPYQNQGLATEGARAIINLAFNELRLPELIAITALGNTPSRRVMEKLGMTHHSDLDFDHPRIPVGDPHRRHALYTLRAGER